MNRRVFVASVAAAPTILGANDRVNTAVVGLGGRGRDHMNELAAQPASRIVAVCDVNQAAQERAVALVEKLTGVKPKAYSDMREMFASKEIDAVTVATPNHWHALSTIWACQAGKDVYVEKPACHNVFEGGKMIEAARKYKRIVQVGSQGRSIAHKIRAVQLLREGVIGKIYMARGLCYRRRLSIGRTPNEPVPPGINWDIFLGPAQMRPYSKNRYDYNWHWFWDTGNGDIGNQGVHEMDFCRWALGVQRPPRSVVSTGGKYIYDDDQETPNTQQAMFDYGDMELVFEVRGLLTGGEGSIEISGGSVVGQLIYGSDGYMAVDHEGFRVFKGEKREKVMEERSKEAKTWDTAPHFAGFLEAVRTRDEKKLSAPVEAGVAAANLCHYANISYRTGRKLALDAGGGITGDDAAARMLTRDYRAPYVVPEKV